MNNTFKLDPIRLFGDYMKVTGVPTLADEPGDDPALKGKKLGVVNGASWTSLWSTYFGKLMLPGVKIINVGNEAVQLNFMEAHHRGEPVPPQINIDLFCNYAKDLFDLVKVDAILISCSTMNRAFKQVSEKIKTQSTPRAQRKSRENGSSDCARLSGLRELGVLRSIYFSPIIHSNRIKVRANMR